MTAVSGEQLSIDGLLEEHDAVFLGIGLGGVNALGVDGDADEAVANAVDFIADLRQADISWCPWDAACLSSVAG